MCELADFQNADRSSSVDLVRPGGSVPPRSLSTMKTLKSLAHRIQATWQSSPRKSITNPPGYSRKPCNRLPDENHFKHARRFSSRLKVTGSTILVLYRLRYPSTAVYTFAKPGTKPNRVRSLPTKSRTFRNIRPLQSTADHRHFFTQVVSKAVAPADLKCSYEHLNCKVCSFMLSSVILKTILGNAQHIRQHTRTLPTDPNTPIKTPSKNNIYNRVFR